MTKFQFRLSRVKDYRLRQVESAEEKLRLLNTELESLRAARARIQEEYLQEERTLQLRRTAEPRDFIALGRYRRHTEKEQAKADTQIAACLARVESQRLEVMEAERRYRLLDKLFIRRQGEWTLAFAKEVDALAEEAFLARWKRPDLGVP